MLRLLCVTAHPDDEAVFGGTLLHYAERGVETYLLCLTPGQAARNRGSAASDEELAQLRRREFAASCRILHISHGEVLDYPDAHLPHSDFYGMVHEVTRRLRTIRPQVVITFGTEGGFTAHTDHVMAALVATLAFHWAGQPQRFPEHFSNGLNPYRPHKLYYRTDEFTFPDRLPLSMAPVSARLDVADYLEKKLEAFRAHLTQGPLVTRFEKSVRRRGPRELYHLAAAITPRAIEAETDLFAGVTDD